MSAVRNEKAEALPATIIGAVVGSIVMVGLIPVLMQVQTLFGNALQEIVEKPDRAYLEASLDTDLSYDFVREATADHLEFTLIDDDRCREAKWDITNNVDWLGNDIGTQTLSRQQLHYATNDCTGEATIKTVAITVVDARFEIKNKASRELIVVSNIGTLTADDAIPNPDNLKNRAASNESTLAKKIAIESEDFTSNAHISY